MVYVYRPAHTMSPDGCFERIRPHVHCAPNSTVLTACVTHTYPTFTVMQTPVGLKPVMLVSRIICRHWYFSRLLSSSPISFQHHGEVETIQDGKCITEVERFEGFVVADTGLRPFL
jgi:hypothetical protein